jgi:diguanylate cyclase (GGDEF)-like protein
VGFNLRIDNAYLVNILILLIYVIIFIAVNYKVKRGSVKYYILIGILIGFGTILLMMNPYNLIPGFIFDSRSVILSVGGLFFGPISAIIGSLISIIYRIILGGTGVLGGIGVIALSSFIGVYWPKISKRLKIYNDYVSYFLFGFLVHVGSLSILLLMYRNILFEQFIEIALIFLVVNPLTVVAVSLVIGLQRKNYDINEQIKTQRNFIQSSVDGTDTIEIYSLDANFNYLIFNAYHKAQMYRFYGVDIKIGMNFIEIIENSKMQKRLKENVQRAFLGERFIRESQIESNHERYVEEHYSPIYENGKIMGITVFSYDVSTRKQHEKLITYYSYHDALTNLYNRRYYQEKLDNISNQNYLPLSLVLLDVNGLKVINDTFGHIAGDELLINVGRSLTETFGLYGDICRIGGDEFVVILKKTTYNDAEEYLEAFHESIKKLNVNGMPISVASGLQTAHSFEDLKTIFKITEESMLRNKLMDKSSVRNETVSTLVKVLYEKNPREEKHSQRVSNICRLIGKKLGLKEHDLRQLEGISSLHDIGKIAIDDRILNKPAPLTKEEWDVIKTHPEIGYRILSTSTEYAEIAYDILSHHEKIDGTGYPRGLKGDEIPLKARIISVADAFDAMISDRPYRKAMSLDDAVAELIRCKGTHFDPKIVDTLLDVIEEKYQRKFQRL